MTNIIGNLFYGAILTIPALVLSIGVLFTQGIAWLMGILLDWVISPNFVSYSYTRPCSPPQNIVGDCNPIVGVGLQITQGLVNLILVVVLVYAAISIALRLGGETQAKKIFFRLIIIALLVNFAPVLVGLIVDAANITMQFFLTPIQEGTSATLTQIAPIMGNIWSSIWNAQAGLKDRIGLLAVGGVAIMLNFMVAFAFLLFIGLFIVRYIAIWILVILSPIALIMWILPGKANQFWNMWWNNLIQWSVIGIPAAFFLYLGIGSFSAISKVFSARLSGPLPPTELNLFSQLIPFAVTTTFLFLGFFVGLTTSAMGASALIAGGKAAGAKLGYKTGQGALRTREGAKNMAGTYRAARRLQGTGGGPRGGALGAAWVAATRPTVKGISAWGKRVQAAPTGRKRVGELLRPFGTGLTAVGRGVADVFEAYQAEFEKEGKKTGFPQIKDEFKKGLGIKKKKGGDKWVEELKDILREELKEEGEKKGEELKEEGEKKEKEKS